MLSNSYGLVAKFGAAHTSSKSLTEEQASQAPTKVQLLAFAESIAAASSKPGPFGHNWVDRFL
ncbi:hypothetical protein S40285_10921 [Stachybotrys chlorohalonatus IBT 40285]|uniref:Uncharacterized protein n=1 Tax=Stachybotrys chlorohalonatus (strain IBT 40285) TaxID=1283841 RepID=A0A084Q890_STAC4|nr:hypothetical protein S40285_10921 [Stachybotrys chlorohalonata IBT 40285]